MKPVPVPSKDYTRQYTALLPELMPLIERVLLNENPILGPSVQRFERAFADYLGTAHGVGLGSGTAALVLALRVLGIGPGDEVITQANTFIATVTAIRQVGAKAVLLDPDPRTMALDPAAVAAAATPRTKAVIPVHLYGHLSPMAELGAVAREKKIELIEDVAQAHGARDAAGKRAGSFGRLGAFSFHPSKNLGAFGDGGFLATDDEALADGLRVLRNLGKKGKYDVRALAPNTKLDTLQAAILALKLEHLDEHNARRRAHAGRYRAALEGVGDLILPFDQPGDVYHLYVVRTDRRDELKRFLGERGLKASLHYPIPPHLQDQPDDLGYRRGDLPVAEKLADTVLSLPVAPELTDDEIDRVAEGVRAFFGAS